VSILVRFEDEADAEYREAGRWYDARQAGLGIEFPDEVDSIVRRILTFPSHRRPGRLSREGSRTFGRRQSRPEIDGYKLVPLALLW